MEGQEGGFGEGPHITENNKGEGEDTRPRVGGG